MNLNQVDMQGYRDRGFVIVEQFFDDREVAAMRAELDRLKASEAAKNVATDGDGQTISRTRANLQIIPLNRVSDLFCAFPFQPKVLDMVSRCIGEPFVRQLDQIFSKPAGSGAGTAWHQDNAYFKISDPTMGVGMWTALHDANRANGTLEVVPASHAVALDHQRSPDSDHHIFCTVEDESAAVPVEVEAGGVIFFNYGIAHRTGPNRSDSERAGLAFHFLRTDYINYEHGNWQYVHLRGEQASRGVSEYGNDLSNAWRQQVDRVLEKAAGPRR